MDLEFPGFRRLSPLASAGAHRVYAAESNQFDRVCALKTLRPGSSLESVEAKMLVQEARVLSKLSHRSIVGFVAFHNEGRPFLALELLDGETLRQVLQRRLRLNLDLALAILCDILDACAYLHRRGYAHRDIKPANVLVTREGVAKLIDFGIAAELGRPTPERRRQGRMSFGTPGYMAPEQGITEVPAAQSDLFSVGVTAYEMLTGKRPYEDGSEASSPPSLRKRLRDTPRELDEVMNRLLARNPADRFADAEAALEAVDTMLRARTRQKRADIVALAFESPNVEPVRYAPERARGDVMTGFALIGMTFWALAGLLQFFVADERAIRQTGTEPLLLAPENAAKLRVLAYPWAEIWVDGELVDTTPLGRLIPLKPGVHFVSFRNPYAIAEERKITVTKGELVTLDVQLQLREGAEAGVLPLDAGSDARLSRNPDEPRVKVNK
jgi:eukaryotic-like serine/threonine-protein kinase